MMATFAIFSFISTLILSIIPYINAKLIYYKLHRLSTFISFSGGVSLAWVFIGFLPTLAINEQTPEAKSHIIAGHVYYVLLFGVLSFWAIGAMNKREGSFRESLTPFWTSLLAYSIFNFMVGWAVCDEFSPQMKPLALFTTAMAFHFFVNDYTLNTRFHNPYEQLGRSTLIAALVLGWIIGTSIELPKFLLSPVIAFISGAMIMQVFTYELTHGDPRLTAKPFIVGAAGFATLLLLNH